MPEIATISTYARGMIIAQSWQGETKIAAEREDALGTRRVGDDAVIRMTTVEETVLKGISQPSRP